MMHARYAIHSIFLLSLPLVVAAFGLSMLSAAGLVLLALLWRWLLTLTALVGPPRGPDMVLDTIPLSHFAEKARWCMDRLGVDYEENASAGVIGVFLTGRTVPRLRFRTGRTRSSLGNSPEILRYLWGASYAGQPDRAAFLAPTPERLDYEGRIDRCGVNLQIWVYYHILGDRQLTQRLWGGNHARVAVWQRLLMRALYPVLALFLRRAFAIDDKHYARAVHYIDELLSDVETRLADGRRSILGGDDLTFVDITFAAISGLWLQPDGYGGGKADACRVPLNQVPPAMRADIERWIEDYPRATAFIRRMYAEERFAGTSDAGNGQITAVKANVGVL